jgi:hypothetical protein
MLQIMADQAMPLESVNQDMTADDAISKGVTVEGAALGGAGAIAEVEELGDQEVEDGVDGNALPVVAVTSPVSSVSSVGLSQVDRLCSYENFFVS